MRFSIEAGGTSGTLFVPDHYRPKPGSGTGVVVFIHGAAWVAEQEFFRSGKTGVLVSLRQPPAGWGAAFSRAGAFTSVLNATTETLAREAITSAPIAHLCVASFSGGYAGVRSILATTSTREMVTDVVLADSLYPARVRPDSNKFDEAGIYPVLAFARAAAENTSGAARRKTLWLSQLFPPEEKYRTNTTTLAAALLISKVGASRRDDGATSSSRGASILYRAERGGFHVLGYGGMTTQDHFEHFYGIGDLLKGTTLDDI